MKPRSASSGTVSHPRLASATTMSSESMRSASVETINLGRDTRSASTPAGIAMRRNGNVCAV